MLEVETLLKQVFPQVELEAPADLHAMEESIRRSHGVADVVIAMGGDGTLHRALQWIDLDSQTLALLPGGTGNDLARSLGYPEDLHGRVAHLLRLAPRAIDIGLVHLDTGDGADATTTIRYHNSAGLGLDATTLAARNSNELLRRNYKLAFACVLFRLKPISAQVSADGRSLPGSYLWVLAMNNRDIGRGSQVAPAARLDDGLLDLLLVEDMPRIELVKLMPKSDHGEHVHHPKVHYTQAAEIVCELEREVKSVAVDGELYPCATREVRFSVRPRALRILSAPAKAKTPDL
jgi:YegS/Rv2252/BmrU family lipid kinase